VIDTVVVDNVTKSFGRSRALSELSFTARRGVTGLLGPNGAGKTTLIRLLATVLAADSGSVRLLGRDPVRDRLEIRRRLGYLPQEPGFQRGFTVFEFVDYVAILKEMVDRRARHDEVRRVIAEVGLTDVSGKRIRALSGGMRRRVGIAQALIGEPELVILDEPTAGLDPEQRLRFRDLISRIGEDRTVLLATHQSEDVAALCERIVVLKGGTSVFTGTPEELRGLADDQVWLSPERAGMLSWRTGEGMFRNIGSPPGNARLIAPTFEDGYLLLLGDTATEVTV